MRENNLSVSNAQWIFLLIWIGLLVYTLGSFDIFLNIYFWVVIVLLTTYRQWRGLKFSFFDILNITHFQLTWRTFLEVILSVNLVSYVFHAQSDGGKFTLFIGWTTCLLAFHFYISDGIFSKLKKQ